MGVLGALGAVFGSLAALFVLIVIGAVMMHGADSDSDDSSPVAIPTWQPSDDPSDEPSYEPSQDTTENTPDRSEEPTPSPSESEDDEPETTVTPPARVQVNTSLKNNSMYRAGILPRLNCRAGNASIFSHSQLKALILKTGKCMDRAWKPALEKQGFRFSPPNYAIAAVRGRGACGDYPSAGSIVPYYCPRNNTIYASTSAMAKGSGNALGYGQIISWHGGIIGMMAHEYGHHVQNLTGLMDSWWSSTTASSSQSGKLALSRRLELQANCLSGMWMRSVAASYPVNSARRNELFTFFGRVGDHPGYPRDHGKPVNSGRWFRQGYERSQAYQCNTWMASSSSVS